jgi:hypothetical protein
MGGLATRIGNCAIRSRLKNRSVGRTLQSVPDDYALDYFNSLNLISLKVASIIGKPAWI